MKNLSVISLLIAVLALGIAVFKPQDNDASSKKETAYERVIRTGVLRCGYGLWPPTLLVKDANTGKLQGAMVDIVEEMAKNLSIKVEWTVETGWGSWPEDLNSGRIDAFCASGYRTAPRGRAVLFTSPVFYNAVHAYVRADDTRFDNGLDGLNDAGIKFSTMDGEISAQIPERFFPKATLVSLPQLSTFDALFLNITTGKADIVFNEQSLVEDFIKQHPGSLKRVTKQPFQVFASSFAVGIKEYELAAMLDSALVEMQNGGAVDQILTKNGAGPDTFMRPAIMYKE